MEFKEYLKYLKIQRDFLDDKPYLCESGKIHQKIPLKIIPEVDQDLLYKAIDWEDLRNEIKWITQYSGSDKLSDWYISMRENCLIDIDDAHEEERGKWKIWYDNINDIFVKIKWGSYQLFIDTWTDIVLND